MQWLKSIVIAMGVLIVLGVAGVIYGTYKKITDPSWAPFDPPAAADAVPDNDPAPVAFGDIPLNLADGCVIEDVRPDGGRVYLTIGPGPACNRVVVVDTVTGKVLGSIRAGR